MSVNDHENTGAPPESNQTGRDSSSIPLLGRLMQGTKSNSAKLIDGRIESMPKPTRVEMIGGGGTWGMSIDAHGKRRGEGKLGDEQLREMQEKQGLFNVDFSDRKKAREQISAINRRLAIEIFEGFQRSLEGQAPNIKDQIDEWCRKNGHKISDYIEGKLLTVYSGDSSQLRPYLTVPIAVIVLSRIAKDPHTPRILGMGTDTADLMIPTLDAFLFDSNTAPVIVTGANHPHAAENSDAPENFIAAGRLSGRMLPSGAYYVFGKGETMFKGIDMVKVDPSEERKGGLEGQSTFYAPQSTSDRVKTVLQYAPSRFENNDEDPIPKNHVIRNLDFERLYDAMSGTLVIDLGGQNAGEVIMDQVFDPSIKTIVVAAHSLGNADNEIRHYLVQAAKAGKIVIVVSRSLIGKTDATYDAALLRENEPGGKLHKSGMEFVEGSGLSPAAARAIATRGIVEGLRPGELQTLINTWRAAKGIA